ncbi:hypothetical protein PHYSODRAFT_333397 [Phytophthora sojae]|uniref:Uncharacterized protein n=1 Tax=Phytophthora sojae (strain P6497) TaxID=1094619 RepID=G4ZP86_PHYSP|nr:hypothetical protein PHYSODRAFT_333397 [Phytophthora sojae]EGZ15126.1 hypothetical protein PHYSODRAFT_333397 [Phytophthora sojae]|eukprot:XP_009528875.1 hypothetical protein PHYSODRAFT_333397 [Phytophthora sojae]
MASGLPRAASWLRCWELGAGALISVGPTGDASAESPAGDSEGPSASRSSPSAPPTRTAAGPGDSSPPGGLPKGGSSDSSETSEDHAALMREIFGSNDEEEASAAQRTGPAAPPAPQATAAEIPVAAQAAPAALPRRPTLGRLRFTFTLVDASDPAAGSRKLSNLASLFLEPGFVSPGGQECWSLIQNASVPLIFDDAIVAPCSADGIKAFGNLRQLFPDPCLIDVTGYPPSRASSRRATGHQLFVRLRRQFQGNSFHPNEKGDLGLALWERRHWIRAKAVKAFIANLAATLGHRNPVVVKLRKKWAK